MFIERFQEQNIPEKGTLLLKAKVIGNPVPEVMWLRNNKPLEPSSNVKQVYDGENIELVITSMNSEVDAGDYKCIANNSIGKASHGARVTVDVEKVTFTKKLRKLYQAEETKTLILECETSHTVSTKWFHDEKELSGMDHRELVEEGRSHKLIIKKTTIRDSGIYKCTVKGQKTETTVEIKPTKAEFIRKLEDFEVKEKELAILEVEVSSETADVTWIKNGKPITETDDTKYTIEKKGSVRKLFVRNISIHDEGEYSCRLPDQECTAEITVIELPPEIITKMTDLTIPEGEKAMFEIELTKGDALVRWFKDGKELQFSEHIQLSIDGKKQKLKIYNTELKDAGVYSCEVNIPPLFSKQQ